MMAEDLDSPLRVDDCERCGAIHWRDCVCTPARTRPAPSAAELELAREERLSRHERLRGAA